MGAVWLEREGSGPWGTFGRLHLDDWSCATLEPPWRGNARRISCIPQGIYEMRLRESPIVRQVTGGRYKSGWEVTDVHERTFIMFHPGNWVRNTDGCVLVGREPDIIGDPARRGAMTPGITHSQIAFDALMVRLASQSTWDIHIKWASYDYP